MADPMKKFLRDMEWREQARIADSAARAMAEHCDKRIATTAKLIRRLAEAMDQRCPARSRTAAQKAAFRWLSKNEAA